MSIVQLLALLLTLSALFSYVNHRWMKLPTTIGIMVAAMAFSIALILGGTLYEPVYEQAAQIVDGLEFDKLLMHGMLGFLLFAGALHVDLGDLAKQKLVILVLATVSVSLSTVLVGVAAWLLLPMLGMPMKLTYCLLFGALISPTDPIAVLGLLKRLGAPKTLATKIAGESLFNDGVGVVIFIALFHIAGLDPTHADVTAAGIAKLFAIEALGGAVFGLLIGGLAFWMLKSVDDHHVEILISLALVCGGYVLATALHLSGPIAMVVAGLLIGNHGRALAMNEATRQRLDLFWELIDEILNAVLFVLLGLEIVALSLRGEHLLAGVLLVPLVLLVRMVCVGLPVTVMRPLRNFSPHVIKVLTWGGLRGGISVALALSLPKTVADAPFDERQLIVTATYVIVVFSVIVQGLTIGPLLRRWGLAGG